MKLHENQQKLILHLIRLNILAYEDCLKFLDTENTGDMVAMSYAFRPLTKNGYVSKSKDGVVTVLQKGRNLFPDEGPLPAGEKSGRVFYPQPGLQGCWWLMINGMPFMTLETEPWSGSFGRKAPCFITSTAPLRPKQME